MSKGCEICGKNVQIGHNVSHAKNRTRRVFMPNLRQARILVGSVVNSMQVCMKCLKRAKKDGRYVLPKVKTKVAAVQPTVKESEVKKPPAKPIEVAKKQIETPKETAVKKKTVVRKKVAAPKATPEATA